MPDASLSAAACVLVTGATGFLGKVVLEELLRLQEQVGVEKIILIIRSKGAKSHVQRFETGIVNSACFSNMPNNWWRCIDVVEGDLSQPSCGVADDDLEKITRDVTHIIHCAASVEFELPVRRAAQANIDSALNILELAKRCSHLQQLVCVSTAYVTPFQAGPLYEELAPLPRPAAELYADILSASVSEQELLQSTGHPNTYTLTKSIAEHLLCERRGHISLSIVRPSIISASLRYPHVGWIDSHAALAAFVVVIGRGLLRVVDACKSTYLDVVPVDEVVAAILHQAFAQQATQQVSILYAVAGKDTSILIEEWVSMLVRYFQRYPQGKRADLKYVGRCNVYYQIYRLLYHQLPYTTASLFYYVIRDTKKSQQLKRLLKKLDMINRAFAYFTHRTFDFKISRPLGAHFNARLYVDIVAEGVLRYLLAQDPTQVVLDTSKHASRLSSLLDLWWAATQPKGSLAIRLSALALKKAMRLMFDDVTFNQKSFEMAMGSIAQDTHVVIVPTHRSYMDFLICSYLFFAKPELKIPIPHIAAAYEFSQIPLIGWLFGQLQAFYVHRGRGRPDPALTKKIHRLIEHGQTIQFFIEGQRSRSRAFLRPKRGLLRCLQSTGQKIAILPVAISYDRVPEESTFLQELLGARKQPMHLRHLFGWMKKMVHHKIHLGSLHIQCGNPVALHTDSDVYAVSHQIMQELQRSTVVTEYQLQHFIAQENLSLLDIAWLKEAICNRGGIVLTAPQTTMAPEVLDAAIVKTFSMHWIHLFLRDAIVLRPKNRALQVYKNQMGYDLGNHEACISPDEKDTHKIVLDKRLVILIDKIFAPICADYIAVAESLRVLHVHQKELVSKDQILLQTNYQDYNTACLALQAFEENGFIKLFNQDQYMLLATSSELQNFIQESQWRVFVRKAKKETAKTLSRAI